MYKRQTETQEVIDRRLETAREELAAQDEFDTIIVNNDLDEAVSGISDILLSVNRPTNE